jgi:hypothetical protein
VRHPRLVDQCIDTFVGALGVAALQALFVLSGLLLAARFVSAGVYLYTAPDRAPQDGQRMGAPGDAG